MPIGNTYGSGLGQIWLYDVKCTGTETSLADCEHRGWGVHTCDHSEDVSIRCSNSKCILVSVDNNRQESRRTLFVSRH